jgi:hypothetical protein
MTELNKQIRLGLEALEYIEAHLRCGGSLSHHLLELLDLHKGTVLTYLPGTVTDAEAKDFSSGGKVFIPGNSGAGLHVRGAEGTEWTMVPKANSDQILAAIVYKYLETGADRVCTLEDAVARPGDPSVKSTEQILVFNNGVLHWLSSQNDLSTIQKIIHRARSWRFVCAMTLAKDLPMPPAPGEQLSETQLKSLAGQTETLAVDAYDGEGYLIWSRAPMDSDPAHRYLQNP